MIFSNFAAQESIVFLIFEEIILTIRALHWTKNTIFAVSDRRNGRIYRKRFLLYPDIRNLVNFYTSFVIYSKSALYKIHIAFKEQIRNKTVFFYNSVFFSFHLISFFALGNIWVSQQVDFWLKYPLAKSSDFPNI